MYSLSFGRNANFNFVQKLAAQNDGVARKIYEDSDADLQVCLVAPSIYMYIHTCIHTINHAPPLFWVPDTRY